MPSAAFAHSAVLLAITIFGSDADASTSECPTIALKSKHFTKIHGRTCYLFVNEEKFWKEARSACWNMGGEMLSIKDSKTMQFIQSALNSQLLGRFDRVWLGAMYHRGTWRWTTGEELDYHFWASGEPSKVFGFLSFEDCALMRREDNWRWHDYRCGSMWFHYKYICEFPFNEHGHYEAHSVGQKDNGNTAVLTIILVTGGTVLLILLLLFMFVRRRYNYKKVMGQPDVHFENRSSSHTAHPPGSLLALQPLQPSLADQRHPCDTLRLIPAAAGHVSEDTQEACAVDIRKEKGLTTPEQSPPATSQERDEMLGACGGAFSEEDEVNTPLAAATGGKSDESLDSLADSLLLNTSDIKTEPMVTSGSLLLAQASAGLGEKSVCISVTDDNLKTTDMVVNRNVTRETGGHTEGRQTQSPDYSNLTTSSLSKMSEDDPLL